MHQEQIMQVFGNGLCISLEISSEIKVAFIYLFIYLYMYLFNVDNVCLRVCKCTMCMSHLLEPELWMWVLRIKSRFSVRSQC